MDASLRVKKAHSRARASQRSILATPGAVFERSVSVAFIEGKVRKKLGIKRPRRRWDLLLGSVVSNAS